MVPRIVVLVWACSPGPGSKSLHEMCQPHHFGNPKVDLGLVSCNRVVENQWEGPQVQSWSPDYSQTQPNTSTPQLPFKIPHIPTNRDQKTLKRATLGGLGRALIWPYLSFKGALKGTMEPVTRGLRGANARLAPLWPGDAEQARSGDAEPLGGPTPGLLLRIFS